MARKKKSVDVQKFGGDEHLGQTHMHGYNHDIESVEAKSQTSLENDVGVGNPIVIRCFEFKMNPEIFKQNPPTKQELFNHHHKGIEMALFRDGLKVVPEINPRMVFNEKSLKYAIFIGAMPMKGFILQERPQTLSEIAHG